MSKILTQLQHDLKSFGTKKESIDSLFIGGGTPSSVEAKLFESFFKKLSPFLKSDAEITIESNPNSLTKEWLEEMIEFNVNRISLGVQSFDNEKLRFLGRNHDKKRAFEAIELLKNSEISNFSIDLIYATKFDSISFLKKEIETLKQFDLPHISLYELIIESNTNFEKLGIKSKQDVEIDRFLIDSLQSIGLKQYEISNFGKIYSKHNLGYWQYKNYIGIGSGAVGFDGKNRYESLKDVASYIRNPLFKSYELIDEKKKRLERLFLGLRSIVGVDMSILTKKQIEASYTLEREGKVTIKDGKIYNNDFLLSDEIALYLDSLS